jgi:DNA-binding GntR family transcriptional regulator
MIDPDALDGALERHDLKAGSTRSEIIYRDIKDSILTGKLKSNQRLTQREVAERFNVSLAPVREAITRLASEGLVAVSAQSEVRVIDLGRDAYGKIVEIIRLLDIAAMKKVLKQIPAGKVEELRNLTNELERMYERADLEAYLRVNDEIHSFLWRLYDNDFMYQVLSDSVDKVKMIATNLLAYYSPRVLKRSLDHHRKLLEAIEQQSFPKVERVLRQHWNPEFFT